MKTKLFKLSAAFALVVVAIGCASAPALPSNEAPPINPPAEAISTPKLNTWTDDFNEALAPGWSWVDEDSTHWSLSAAPGALRIITQGQSLYNADKPKNLLLRDALAGDFEIMTKVTFDPQRDFQQAAILIYQDEDNFVLLNRGFCGVEGCPGGGVFMENEMNGETLFDNPGPRAAVSLQMTWLRLQKAGTTYTGFYSADGQRWTELGRVENPLQPTKVGLTANNSNADPSVPQIPADYDSFTIEAASLSTGLEQGQLVASPTELTSDQIVAKISVGAEPFRVAIGEGAIWVTDQHDAAVYRIDPRTNEVVATISLRGVPKGLVVGEGAIWVATLDGLARIDPQTNEIITTIEVGQGLNAAIGAGSVWVTSTNGVVSRIDPETDQVIASITVGGIPSQIAIANEAVWVANRESTSVSRIDPQTNQVVASIDVGFSTLAMAADQDGVWVAGYSDPTLLRIDPQTNQVVARIPVGLSSWGIAADKDAVWVTSNSNKTLWRIDPQTNQVVAAYKIGLGPLGVAIGEGDLWVATSFDQTVWRIKP